MTRFELVTKQVDRWYHHAIFWTVFTTVVTPIIAAVLLAVFGLLSLLWLVKWWALLFIFFAVAGTATALHIVAIREERERARRWEKLRNDAADVDNR